MDALTDKIAFRLEMPTICDVLNDNFKCNREVCGL